MSAEFAHNALVAGTNQLTENERLALGLSEPAHPFALSQRQVREVTRNRIRAMFMELTHSQMPTLEAALNQLALLDPAEYVHCLVELAQFTLPKLKATAVDLRSSDGSVKTLTFAELQAIVQGQA